MFFKKQTSMLNWHQLESENQLEKIIEESTTNPIAIFKHSVRCGISSGVKRRLQNQWDIPEDRLKIYYLDLIRHRTISNKIESMFGIRHQSPQLIILENGSVHFHTSHGDITVNTINQALEKLRN